MQLTIRSFLDGISQGTFTAQEVVDHYLKKAEQDEKGLHAFVRLEKEYVQSFPFSSDSLLKGLPLGIKDNILTKGMISSCGSKMLENYVSPYSATCFQKLEDAGAVMLGKTNMDEFAMGSSTESSFFGPTKNPYGKNRTPGGSSGGSAAAVAADLCIAAIGSDTGGSIRQPAALCGIVGVKPTYGRVSRYGVQSMASSLDQVGTFTKTVEDARILLSALSGYDKHDVQSSLHADQKNFEKKSDSFSLSHCKILVPTEALGEGLDEKIKERFLSLIEKLKSLGCRVEEKSVPLLNAGISMYYTLMPAEVSTNLSRFDGIRFGLQKEMSDFSSLAEYYAAVRSEGFGDEVKRRILLGTFVLSSANYEGYYLRAQQARVALKKDFENLFSQYDVILTPTSPELAWKIGEKTNDPLKMYLADIYTISANLAGIPAMSVPMGMIEDQGEMLPSGIQIMANVWREDVMFDVAQEIEKLV